MALAPRDIDVTREQVLGWYQDWTRANNLPTFSTPWDQYLQSKLDELDLPDQMVSTPNHDGFDDETSLREMILHDMDSYTSSDGKIKIHI